MPVLQSEFARLKRSRVPAWGDAPNRHSPQGQALKQRLVDKSRPALATLGLSASNQALGAVSWDRRQSQPADPSTVPARTTAMSKVAERQSGRCRMIWKHRTLALTIPWHKAVRRLSVCAALGAYYDTKHVYYVRGTTIMYVLLSGTWLVYADDPLLWYLTTQG